MKLEGAEGSEMKYINQPVFALDLCCNDTLWLRNRGFTSPDVIGDVYHITKRILSAASLENRPSLGLFAADLRKCFGSTSVGIFWPAEKIISSIELVQLKYEKPDIGVWTANTTKAFNTEKKHIRDCLAMPRVRLRFNLFHIAFSLTFYFIHPKCFPSLCITSKDINPICVHRDGRCILQRGTNNCESTWR
jgi:hypothetical protein